MQLRLWIIDASAIMWPKHVRICVKMLNYAYNFRLFAGLRPAPRLGLPPQTQYRCASEAKYGPFTVTPANRREDERRNQHGVFVRIHGDVLERLLGAWPCRLTHTLTADLAIKHTIALIVKAWPSKRGEHRDFWQMAL